MIFNVKAIFLSAFICATMLIGFSEEKKLLKLAAAAALFRGGPIIPLPIPIRVHSEQPKPQLIRVPEPVHVPVHTKEYVPVHHNHESVVFLDEGHGSEGGFEGGYEGGNDLKGDHGGDWW